MSITSAGSSPVVTVTAGALSAAISIGARADSVSINTPLNASVNTTTLEITKTDRTIFTPFYTSTNPTISNGYKLWQSDLVDMAVKIRGTYDTSEYWGCAAKMDSETNPQNGLRAYYYNVDGTYCYVVLEKIVAGVVTVLVSDWTNTAATGYATSGAGRQPVTNAWLEIRVSDTSVSLWQYGLQVGTTQTVNDAAILAGTYFGVYSTEGVSTLAALYCSQTTTEFYLGAFGSSLVAGNEAKILQNKISINQPQYHVNLTDQSRSGNWSWSNLVRYPDEMGAGADYNLIMCDARSVNEGREQKSLEALYRKIRTAYPTAAIVAAIYPGKTDYSDTTVAELQQQDLDDHALAAAYNVHLYDYRQVVVDDVAGGEPLTTYLSSSELVHPTAYGKTVLTDGIYNDAISGGYLVSETQGELPTATYDTDEYYTDTTPQRINGNANDGETGTGWADVGTAGRVSSTVGDTITFTATCRSFGVYNAASENSYAYDVQIDGGAWQEGVTISHNGQYIADLADGEHTITIRVRSAALRVDEFWAI